MAYEEELALGSSADFLLGSSREYSLYVNRTRHLPSEGDGLKDAMRKALHVMRGRAGSIKTMALSGALTERKLYVHGDASDSVNSITAPFANNLPLLRPKGNFGTRVAPTTFSAPRYTEVERVSYDDLIYLDWEIAPQMPNYDGSVFSPQSFLPAIPLLLVNGMSGVGVGWNTVILPRKPGDVIEAVLAVLDGKKPKQIKPHFGWCDPSIEFLGYGENGGSQWRFGGRATIKDTSTAVVTDLPPLLDLEDYRTTLDGLIEKGKIQDYDDESADAIKIVVSFKRGTLRGWSEADLLNHLRLYQTKTENFVAISVDGESVRHYRSNGADDEDAVTKYLRWWVEWRFGWYEKRFERLVQIDSAELVLQRSIKACSDAGFAEKLRSLNGRSEAIALVKEMARKFGPTDDQAAQIAGMPGYRWTREPIAEVEARIRELEGILAENRAILKSEDRRRGVYRGELTGATAGTVKRALAEVEKMRETVK
jgi:DNA gyrase/topoisomerase IV subunit A